MCALVVLAGNFDILSGKASFTVPEVIAGNDWSVVREWQYVWVSCLEPDDITDSVRWLW